MTPRTACCSPTGALNDWVGAWLCAYPVFTSLALYRPYHLQHHRFTQQTEDPDLSACPRRSRSAVPASDARSSRDLTGADRFPATRRAASPAPWDRPMRRSPRSSAISGARRKGRCRANLLLFAVLTAIGYWWLYPVMWLLPLATWYQLISRIRNIAEHAVVPDNDDPLRNTRTTYANPLERLLLAPYWVNLSPRTSLVHVRAVLALAAGPSRAARGGLPRQDGAAAGLSDSVAARDLAARRSGQDGPRPGGTAQHI